jgi:hypothetical protein
MKAKTVERCCIGLNPNLKITIGENATGAVVFWCKLLSTGEYLKDNVQASMTGQPSGHGEPKPLYDPNPVPSDDGSYKSKTDITVYTNTNSTPGHYTLVIHGRSTKDKDTDPRCRDREEYPDIAAPLAVAPTIDSKKDAVWWFNKADPDQLEKTYGYTMKLEVTAQPVRPKGELTYRWTVKGDGKDYAEFVNEKPTQDTDVNATKIKASHKATEDILGEKKGKFSVTVSVNGVESKPRNLVVKRPYKALPLVVHKGNFYQDFDDDTYHYFTNIFYKLLDQFGTPLPKKVPKREHFTEKDVTPDTSTNWYRADEGGSDKAPEGIIRDEISGQRDKKGFTEYHPKALAAGSDAKVEPTIHWSGWVSVGSVDIKGAINSPNATPIGVKIMTLTWQKFRDRSRHCDITSPIDGGTHCPCGEVRESGECAAWSK